MYDFLIVGAGAAGAAMAARLTDGTDKTVLLLESGPDYLSADQPGEMASPNPFNLLLPRHEASRKKGEGWFDDVMKEEEGLGSPSGRGLGLGAGSLG